MVFEARYAVDTGFACLEDENRRIPYDAKISPSRWIEFNTCSCGNPGHWHRIMK